MMTRIAIIGAGRMGGALAIALSRSGFRISDIVHRSDDTAAEVANVISPRPRLLTSVDLLGPELPDIVLITVGDSDLPTVVSDLANVAQDPTIVLHSSGALGSDVLAELAERRWRTGSLHPLISISDPLSGSTRFAGSYFCVEGDAAALRSAELIVEALGGQTFSIPTHLKPLYHASAVMASGHVTATIDTAFSTLEACGLDPAETAKVLFPLIVSTLENIREQGTVNALTGSFARADGDVVARHLDSLAVNCPPDVTEIYRVLGERSLKLAESRGVSLPKIAAVRDRISRK